MRTLHPCLLPADRRLPQICRPFEAPTKVSLRRNIPTIECRYFGKIGMAAVWENTQTLVWGKQSARLSAVHMPPPPAPVLRAEARTHFIAKRGRFYV